MVLYFSGTGNSKYIANKIANATNDKIFSINDQIKRNDTSDLNVDGVLVIVGPSYYFRYPHIVEEWLINKRLINVTKCYFIITYYSMYENASGYNKKIARLKNMEYMGTLPIKMPNNHITQYVPSTVKEASEIVDNADIVIKKAIEIIKDGNVFPEYKVNVVNRFMSRCVNPLLYKLFISSKRFYATDKCISCNKCVLLCPLNNIKIINNKPIWGNSCTHCLSCISYCPNNAIEYKRKSENKDRYTIEMVRKGTNN